MEKHNLLNRLSFGHDHDHFENPAKDHHDHLVCTECEKIIEFNNEELEKVKSGVAQKNRFSMQYHRLEIFGICDDCRKGGKK